MTTTTRYGFTVPTVGSDNNAWGTALNTDLNSIDSYLYLTAIGNIGATAPATPTPAAGMIWIDNTTPSATVWNVQMYDGTNWVVMGTLDSDNHEYTANGQVLPTLDGQVIIGATSGSPAAATITAGTGVSITNAANSITVGLSTPVSATNGGTGVASPTTNGILVAKGSSAMVTKVLTNGQLLIGSTGAEPVGASLTAGNGINITNAAGAIILTANTALTWAVIPFTGTNITIQGNFGYVANNFSTQINFNLSSGGTIGTVVEIIGYAAGGWKITPASGYIIKYGTQTTTNPGGSLTCADATDCIKLVSCGTLDGLVVFTVVSAVTSGFTIV